MGLFRRRREALPSLMMRLELRKGGTFGTLVALLNSPFCSILAKKAEE